MRIAVNLRQYYKGKIGGMENYLRNVIQRLQHHQMEIWVHDEEVENVREFAPTAQIRGFSHAEALPAIERAARSGDFDLYFCPLLVLEPLVVERPSGVMMPDVQHEFFPDFFEKDVLQWRRRNYGPTALNCDVLFTLSSHAKTTIVDRFRVLPDKVEVIHLDADEEFKRPAPASPSASFRNLNLPAKYLYFPANFWPHKNHSNILKAFRQVLDSGFGSVHLLLSGARSGAERIEEEIHRLGLNKNVRILGYVEKAVIPEIYRHSQALVFATKFEGFGIPILEAFHTQTPCVTSNSGSCVEVAADAAVLVDPLRPEEIAEGIRSLLADEELRARLVARGADRVRQFSWDRAAELTERAFLKVTSTSYRRPARISVNDWPAISVITPTYNMGRFLEETINSVISQEYPHVEYVVIDGGSSDNSVELLRKYSGKLKWVSEKDQGQADAINKGFHASSGEIFAYLNSDDTYLPGALGKIGRHFRENPGVGLIYGEAYHVKLDGEIISRYPTQTFDYETLNKQCYICQPSAFMLREAFANAGMMNVGMHFALDYELWIRIAKQYGVLKVGDYLATSRMHMDNKTLSSRRKVYQEILSTVKAQYGYAPYEWVNGYACYLLDHKDQYFDRSRPSIRSYALSLMLGMYHNPGQRQRYLAEWQEMTGFGRKFTGRWDDGWISERWQSEQAIPADAVELAIHGKHFAPIGPIQLTVKLNGDTIHREQIGQGGEYSFVARVPESVRGTVCRMEVGTSRTWRPRENGDYRQLGCIVDDVRFEPAR